MIIYVKSDVLQYVFQNFRHVYKKNYDLDCCHLLTLPELAWQASLKMSKQSLELLTNIDTYLFFENGIRGGVSMISKRLAEANNKYMIGYDPNKPSKYIIYWDTNNLYGYAISCYLPYGDFKFIFPDNINEDWVLSILPESKTGYILEVDLDYPAYLHELHNDYPLAPERLEICLEMLSSYNKNLLSQIQYKSLKFAPNLFNKKNMLCITETYNYISP